MWIEAVHYGKGSLTPKPSPPPAKATVELGDRCWEVNGTQNEGQENSNPHLSNYMQTVRILNDTLFKIHIAQPSGTAVYLTLHIMKQ